MIGPKLLATSLVYAIVCAVFSATACGITTKYTDPATFAEATTSPATIGFTNILPSGTSFEGFSPLEVLGVTFSTSTPGTQVNVTAPTFYSPNIYPAPFIVDSVNPSSNNELTISFSQQTFAVGLVYGGLGFSGVSSGTIILSNGLMFSIAMLPTVGHTAFVGFVSTEPITSLELVTTNDSWVLQNLVLANPCGATPSFAEVVQNGVAPPTILPDELDADFTPGCGVTLKEAATLGGYDHFNWVQVITEHDGLAACQETDPFWPFFDPLSVGCLEAANLLTSSVSFPIVPFFDVPPGGFEYQVQACSAASSAPCTFPVEDSLPWYWDEEYTLSFKLPQESIQRTQIESNECHGGDLETCSELEFSDMPDCHILLIEPCTIRFTTTLVGVRTDGTGDALNLAACQIGANLTCQNAGGTGFNWHALGASTTSDGRLQNFQPDPATTVIFDAFKLPGTAGFTQPELEVFAASGIKIRDQSGVAIPVKIDIDPGKFPNVINLRANRLVRVAIISTPTFERR
jgi:hypothetical protein